MEWESALVGVGVCLLSASFSSLGVNLQASALIKQRDIHEKRAIEFQEVVDEQRERSEGHDPDTSYEDSISDLDSVAESPLLSLHLCSLESQPIIRPAGSADILSAQKDEAMLTVQWYVGLSLYLAAQISGSATALKYIPPVLLIVACFHILSSR